MEPAQDGVEVSLPKVVATTGRDDAAERPDGCGHVSRQATRALVPHGREPLTIDCVGLVAGCCQSGGGVVLKTGQQISVAVNVVGAAAVPPR